MESNFAFSSKRIAFVLSLVLALLAVQAVWAQKAYVPNSGSGDVSVIDITSNMVTNTITVGTSPRTIAFSTLLNKVYIGEGSSISVIDATTDMVESTIDVGGTIFGMAVNSTSTKAYVGNNGGGTIRVLDLATNTFEADIPTSTGPFYVAISPDDTKVFVCTGTGGGLIIINTATNMVEATLSLGSPVGITFNANSTKAYVADFGGSSVAVIDVATNTIEATISNISQAYDLDITSDESKLLVTSFDAGTVSVVDLATNMVTGTISVGSSPKAITIDKLSNKAYVPNQGSNNVSVIDIATETVEATIDVGANPEPLGKFIFGEFLPGDACSNAVDINSIFGGEADVPQTSGLFNNNDATTDASDPAFGWECLGEPDGGGSNPELNRTLWFSFTGDGNTYSITTVECSSTDYIDSGDTQMAIYSGSDCNNLTAEACNDDLDINNDIFQAYLEFPTEAGVEYYVMIDGFGGDFPADGEFCIEVTQLPTSSTTEVALSEMNFFPNPTKGILYLDQLDVEQVEVYNEQGQLALTQNQPVQQINISHLPAGMYFIKGIGAAQIYSARVVKE